MEIKAVPSFPNLGVTRDGQVMNMITRRFLKPRDTGHGYMHVFVTINKNIKNIMDIGGVAWMLLY